METALYIDFVHGSKYSSEGKFTTSVNGCVFACFLLFLPLPPSSASSTDYGQASMPRVRSLEHKAPQE